jgi:hypothetical protein
MQTSILERSVPPRAIPPRSVHIEVKLGVHGGAYLPCKVLLSFTGRSLQFSSHQITKAFIGQKEG